MTGKSNKMQRRAQGFAALVAGILVGVIALCYLSLHNLRITVDEEQESYLVDLANSLESTLDNQIKSGLDTLSAMAITIVRDHERGGVDLKFLQERVSLLNFVHVEVMNGQGVATRPDNSTYSYQDNPAVMQVLRGERVVTRPGPEHILLGGSRNSVLLGVPIWKDGKVVGGLLACTGENWSDELVSQNYFGGDIYYHVMEADGDYLLSSNQAYLEALAEAEGVSTLSVGNNLFGDLENYGTLGEDNDSTALRQAVRDGQVYQERFSFHFDKVERTGVLMPLDYGDLRLWMVMTQNASSNHFEQMYVWNIIINVSVVLLFGGVLTMLYRFYRHNSLLNFVDSVTGGYSAARFEQEGEAIIHSHPANTWQLVAMNVDRFKTVNDMFGRGYGDQVLCYIHQVLQRHLEMGALVCRSSADHFDLLMPARSEEKTLEYLGQVLEDLSSGMGELGENKGHIISLSIGVYRIDDPNLPLVLIRDRAMMAQKNNRVVLEDRAGSCGFYSDADRAKLRREQELENKMAAALEAGHFVPYLQPKVDLETGRISGAEGLVRWIDPDEGIISPGEFIPLFERNGFIRKLDLYMFETVCRYQRQWLDEGVEPVPISVNLTRMTLNQPEFLEPYVEIRERYGIPHHLVELEITESMMLENSDEVIRAVEEMHKAGFHCLLDDFGSGYSSLNALKDLNVDVLKLDRAFLRSEDMEEQKERAIVEEVVYMSKKLGMQVCAEGVETSGQAEFLHDLQCDMGQGFLFSRPVDRESFEKMLTHGEGQGFAKLIDSRSAQKEQVEYEMRFYLCKHCGNVIYYANDVGMKVRCCGDEMCLMTPNVVESARRNHAPLIQRRGETVEITVGTGDHPSQDDHFIRWIALHTRRGCQMQAIVPGQKPEAQFKIFEDDEIIAAYDYCSVHGLWMTRL